MRAKALTVALTFVLAATATAGVYLYVRGLQDQGAATGEGVSVIVSREDVPAGTQLDELIVRGAFTEATIEEGNLIAGAVTDLFQLEGQTTSAAILEGEQITTARLQGTGELPGGTLGIPAGHEALTIRLSSPRVAGGVIQRGDHVAVYATLSDQRAGGEVTAVIVPDVEVLRVTGAVAEIEAEGGASGGSGQGMSDDVMVTLALTPNAAQKVVFAQENGSTWLSLLPPGEEGERRPPIDVMQVIR
jgi:pilus assembly protein CpaB